MRTKYAEWAKNNAFQLRSKKHRRRGYVLHCMKNYVFNNNQLCRLK